MNWGKKLTIVFILFAGMIIFMVVKSFQQNFDLVSDNYYEDELVYQERIDAESNAASFSNGIIFTMSPDSVILSMPADGMTGFKSGTIVFYRASDAKLDVKKDLIIDSLGHQLFDRKQFVGGNYEVKLSWEASGKNYFHKAVLQF